MRLPSSELLKSACAGTLGWISARTPQKGRELENTSKSLPNTTSKGFER